MLKLFIKEKIILTFIIFLVTSTIYAQNTSTVSGRVIDATTGEPIFGVTIVVREAGVFAQTDFDGKYTIQLPPGTHTILFQMIGYDTKSQTVTVQAGENISLNMVMGVQALQTVLVEERALNNTEASLLALQKKSPTVSDGISQEAIKRSPDSTASDVIKRVTGISIIGGKYVFVRGLGERYSNTILNGSILPSPEPDKKVVPLDLFPAGLVKNIRVIKTFIPEDPGEFSGGIVKIETQEYPDEFTLNIGIGIEKNSITTHNEFKKLKSEGGNDYLGLGPNSITGLGSKRWDLLGIAGSLPDLIPLTGGSYGLTDQTVAYAFTSFDNNWSPRIIKAPYNYKFDFSIGDTTTFLGKKFGYIYGLTYKKDYEKTKRQEYRWTSKNYLGGNNWIPDLYYISSVNQARLADYYEEKVLWGNNLNLAYKLNDNNQIYLKTFLATNSEKVFRESFAQKIDQDQQEFITNTSYYIAREIFSSTIGGDHGIKYIEEMKPHILKWHYNYARAVRDEPDRKNRLWLRKIGTNDPFLAQQGDGTRYYSFTEDETNTLHLDYELPYKQWADLEAKLKIGYETFQRDKNFKSKTYRYQNVRGVTPLEVYPVPGELTLNTSQLLSGNYIVRQTSAGQNDSYKAEQTIDTFFLQTDLPIIPKLRVIGGFRQEENYQKVQTKKSTSLALNNLIPIDCAPDGLEDLRPYLIEKGLCNQGIGELDEVDILPSINVVYEFIKDQNLRIAYYETVARPDTRELSEFAFSPYFAGERIQGNSALKSSKIKNYDLRWEWYITAEEYIGIAYFEKFIKDPIEMIGQPATGAGERVFTYINSPKATIKGIEVDFRKDFYKYFRIELNLYSIKSEVEVMDPLTRELIAQGFFSIYDKRVSLAPTNLKRPLQGQSDLVYNLKFLYYFDESKKLGYVGLYYNYFSDRIVFAGSLGEPDIYEKGKGFWDLVASYNPAENLSIKASIKNLFNTSFETYQESNLGKYKLPYEKYNEGIDYSLSVSYKF
ncbi:MAG: TonB-dependent receptor [Leptospiraceae bacterium]|nr:MAG: TonB-dependent receptor [Leptospiraceae bacterium]